ncbi:MAG TPA: YfiR family protein [Steroidobacteraceae bacterium]|nr:YfiR family protein [Steroidobacteraceae bacterium]
MTRAKCLAVAAALVFAVSGQLLLAADAPTENQVQAVFLFNFSRFVEWPTQAFAAPNDPFVIGIVGNDPFGARLDQAVRNEQINGHRLTVRRFRSIADVDNCQILFIDRSETGRLGQILSALDHRSILTVSQADGAAQQGVMIQFATEDSRIRLRINVESARAAGLTISSKLLRPAEIVGAQAKEQ